MLEVNQKSSGIEILFTSQKTIISVLSVLYKVKNQNEEKHSETGLANNIQTA